MLAVSYFLFKNDARLPSKSKTKKQDWVIGPLLVNVFICEIFLEYGNNYFANYADNTKVRIVDENAKKVLKNLSPLANSKIRMAC